MNAAAGLSVSLATIEPGFTDPVFDSQAAFRAALEAMSRPGKILAFPAPEAAPAPLAPAAAALLLALCDPDTRLWISPSFAAAAAYLCFHTGCPITMNRADADFALIDGVRGIGPLDAWRSGTEDYPDRSTTLIVQVAGLGGSDAVSPAGGGAVMSASGVPLRLSGPGVDGAAQIVIAGGHREFIDQLLARKRLFPRGNDFFFACGGSIAALPRSTVVEADPACM